MTAGCRQLPSDQIADGVDTEHLASKLKLASSAHCLRAHRFNSCCDRLAGVGHVCSGPTLSGQLNAAVFEWLDQGYEFPEYMIFFN